MNTAGSQFITVQPPSEGRELAIQQNWLSASQIRQRVQIIQQIKAEVMKEGEHFGKIPGCKKDSLWKAGSEQLLMTFNLAANPEVLDLSTADTARFRVTVHITNAANGLYLGSGVGEASSDEEKYKWRAAVCADEFEATPADRRRLKYKSGDRGSYTINQVRTEPADVANTILKMAKKRAQIDATLTVTAASDIFTQDLEDMTTPIIDEHDQGQPGEHEPEPQVQMPTRKAAAPQQQTQQRPTPPPPQQRTQPAAPPSGDVISEPQQRRLYAIYVGKGYTPAEIKQWLSRRHGIQSDREIPRSKYDEIVTAIQQGI